MVRALLMFALFGVVLSSVQETGRADSFDSMPPEFFATLQDVPLMPGLEEIHSRSFSFDKPEGDISEAVAALGAVPEADVLRFYQDVLPQMGWRSAGEATFVRKLEQLTLVFEREPEGPVLRITVQPIR